MEVGSTASVSSAESLPEPDNDSVVVDNRRILTLTNRISAETVEPIIEALQAAEPAEKLVVYIRANNGGQVQQLIRLIQALATTEADVELAIGRYAMSCAAALWLWFALEPIEGDDGVGRVVSVDPRKPAVLLYHRPRWPHTKDGEYYCFIEHFEDEAVRESLKAQVQLFDDLFELLLERQGLGGVHTATLSQDGATYTHHLQFAKDTYYSNRDYVISLEGAVS
nr:hypothetical protein [uncultured Pseudomonas sp.]